MLTVTLYAVKTLRMSPYVAFSACKRSGVARKEGNCVSILILFWYQIHASIEKCIKSQHMLGTGFASYFLMTFYQKDCHGMFMRG